MAFLGIPIRKTTKAASAFLFLALSMPAETQSPLRCDLQLKTTPGAGAAAACLDLIAVREGGQPVQTADNATRISRDGFKLCENAFTVSDDGAADIVFIYDNSGSMWSHFVKIDAATKDTNFYHIDGCGLDPRPTPVGTLTYATNLGTKTVGVVSASTRCEAAWYAGDPYNATGRIIREAIDYLEKNSPNSTVGAVGFADTTMHPRPPLLLSVPGNAAIVRDSIKLDSIRNTKYTGPLRLATEWLKDPALAKNAKKAIVFISDGDPTDEKSSYDRYVGTIPIYSIFLGDSNSTRATVLQDLSTRTKGVYERIDPKNTAKMNTVMQGIIQSITRGNLPVSVEISNASSTPPMSSRSVSMTRNPSDKSVSVTMDSIIALAAGTNKLSIKVTMSSSDIRTYPVTVQADGPAAGASSAQLVCVAQPKLELLNAQGRADAAYPGSAVEYDVKLTRAASELNQVVVTASSGDSAKAQPWGDRESIVLNQTATTGATTVNRRDDYDVNGSVARPAAGNNVLEASPDGTITLKWAHPRDARESASLTLPGKGVPSTDGFIDIVRLTDAPRGGSESIPLDKAVKDPIVLRGGATYKKEGGKSTLNTKGPLHNPLKLEGAVLDPNLIPTFVFKTASPFAYRITIFDHLGNFLNSMDGKVDSLKWEGMRNNADSLAVAMSILPVSHDGQLFATGAYILRATLTTRESVRVTAGRTERISAASRSMVNMFGYVR